MQTYRLAFVAVGLSLVTINIPHLAHAQGVSVIPDGGGASASANTSGNSAVYSVQNLGDPDYLTLSCAYTGAVTGCAVSGTNPIFLGTGASQNVTVTYSTGGAGSGTLTLWAYRLGDDANDSGWFNVTVTVPDVTQPTITLLAPTVQVSAPYPHIQIQWCDNQSLNGQSRVIKLNGATQTASFDYVTGGSGCTVRATSSTSSLTLNAGNTSIEATICDVAGNCRTSTFTVSSRDVTPPRVALLSATAVTTANPQIQIEWCDNESLNTSSDSIRVNGTDRTSTFTYASQGGISGCTVRATSTTTGVTVSQNPANNTVEAQVCDNWGNCAKQTFTVTRVANASTAVPVLSNHNGDNQNRELCLTVPGGADGAVQCGDLIVSHAMPALWTRNTARALTLVYNSATADPRPRVAALVTIQSGATQPTNIYAELWVDSVLRASGTYSSWTPGQTRQIVLGYDASGITTGLHPFMLLVRSIYSGATYDATIVDTLIVINREASEFGAGWHPAGIERLIPPHSGNRILWVGGDGSARVYRNIGTNTWYAAAGTYRDTIVWSPSAGAYERRAQHGVRIWFDAAGRHVSTINRVGITTTFVWNTTTNRLTSINIPPSGTYSFSYTGTTPVLDKITDPAGAPGRVLDATISSGNLTQLIDPDTRSVSFTYDSQKRLTRRTNRLNYGTSYVYGNLRLNRIAIPLTTANDSAVMAITPWDHRGLAFGIATGTLTATTTSNAHTLLDGPRTDVTDTTRFFVDRWGAPTAVRNALGGGTHIARGDGFFPAQVTRVRYPNGRIVAQRYDSRGNPVLEIDSTIVQNGEYATSRYEWDSKWDFVTKIVPPENDSTLMAYDAANGNRLWQQDARGASARVNFTYWGSGTKQGLLRYIDPPLTPNTVLDYDSKANLLTVTTPLGFVTRHNRDAVGRDSVVIGPTGTRDSTVYDLMNRAILQRSWGPAVTYTPASPPTQPVTLPAEAVTANSVYDAEGNLTSLARSQSPNPLGLATLTTVWRYDRANRQVAEVAPDGFKDSTQYDPAGNAIKQVTRRGGTTITLAYDALHRLIQRIMPQRTYAAWSPTGTNITLPLYPNNGSSWRISADTATFSYDSVGNLLTANNGDARIARSYRVDGAVTADELRIRNYIGTGFSQHIYNIQHGYDLNGRRLWTKHPNTIAPRIASTVKDSVAYRYTDFGALGSVRDVLGNVFRYVYDFNSRIDSMISPGGTRENRRYDNDERLVRRIEMSAKSFKRPPAYISTTTVHDDSLRYDARGRVINARTANDTAVNVYSGLGNLAYSWTRFHHDFTTTIESYSIDPLGNQQRSYRKGPIGQLVQPTIDSTGYIYASTTARLTATTGGAGWFGGIYYPLGSVEAMAYDSAGSMQQHAWDGADPQSGTNRERTAYYYGADGMLRALDKRTCNYSGTTCQQASTNVSFSQRSAFEEYRYDALGRRVLIRTRGGFACNASDCDSTVRRLVWDGDQLLYEIRYPGGTSTGSPPATIEQDTGTVAHTNGFGPFGRVAYTHGLDLDRPVGMIRMNFNTNRGTAPGSPMENTWQAPQLVVPHTDWRGRYDLGSFSDSTFERCVNPLDPPSCMLIEWPATFAGYRGLASGTFAPNGWMGSLKDNHRDASGQLYMRNRYYDPATGRFTQEDPIGLAGGLNLYGFANGDPVSYSDPFGLCPEPEDKDGTVCVALFIQQESVLGLRGDNRGFSSSSDPSQSRVFLHVDVENQMFTATANPTCTTGGQCADPLSTNQIDVAFGSDGGFTISVDAKNSILPGPAINGNFTFTPDGRGGFTTAGNRDAFPSAEAYLWRGGQATTLFQRPEKTPLHLLPFMRNDRWP